jgi:acyl carrier protein
MAVSATEQGDGSGSKRLVAYVVTDEGQKPSVGDLRRFLQEKLPEYMVPSAFVELEALPLTPSGKVNRRALPAPTQARLEPEDTFVAPRTAIERTLTEIWARVLGVERVGIHDDFFKIGGHSLLATQVMSRIRDALDIQLPLRDLFKAPTVAGLAESIEEIRWIAQDLLVAPTEEDGFQEGVL